MSFHPITASSPTQPAQAFNELSAAAKEAVRAQLVMWTVLFRQQYVDRFL